MNTIISTKKKFYQEQNISSSDTSIKKINTNNIIIQRPEKAKISNNDMTNSYQDTLNSFDKCQKCHKFEKEIESLVLMKSELENKYQEEKLKNKLLEKKYKTETTQS